MVKINKDTIQEFGSAAIILSILHYIVAGLIVGVITASFSEFFFSTQYLDFIVLMTITFFILEFLIEQLKIRQTTFIRGLKYYIGLAFAVSFVLGETLSTIFLAVTILKVFITVRFLER